MNKSYFFFSLLIFINFLCAEEWPYLTSQALKTRYAITSYLLQDCDEIIEIGGYKTPISNFITDKKIIVIDPKVEPSSNKRVQHLPIMFQEWDENITSSNYGVVLLGLDLHLPQQSWPKLIALMNNAKKVIIEFSLTYKPAQKQFSRICDYINKKISLSLKLDLSENDFSLYPAFYPYRKLCVFE